MANYMLSQQNSMSIKHNVVTTVIRHLGVDSKQTVHKHDCKSRPIRGMGRGEVKEGGLT